MPDDNSKQVAVSSPASLQGAIRYLKLDGNQVHGGSGKAGLYPDRPGEADCLYYMRTGSCGYGVNCRYNHPPHQSAYQREILPERLSQPDCGYYLKTGTCKYGPTCKYHHPRDRNGAGPVSLNSLGLPMRKEEKVCSHYMRYGLCKFGTACKFHHPQPTLHVSGFGNAVYGSDGSSVIVSNLPFVGAVPSWPMSRATYLTEQQSSPAYLPVVIPLSQSLLPPSGWTTYVSGLSNGLSDDYRSYKAENDSPSGDQLLFRSTSNVVLPHRPDQPECRYFINNGTCKYGSECKYHHPFERMFQSLPTVLGPHGFPSRPGEISCSNYTTHGLCKFGASCKFDHPFIGYPYYYNFNLPHSSIDSASSTESRILRNGEISSVAPLCPPSSLPPPVQKLYHAAGKSQKMETNSMKPDINPPKPESSPSPPHPSPSSSDT